MLGGPLERERPAADDDEDDRRAGGDDRLEQLLLAAEQAEVAPVAELAGRRVVGQPGAFADHDDRDVRAAGDARRPSASSASRAVAQVRCPRRGRSARRRTGRASASRIVGIAGELVDRVDHVARREPERVRLVRGSSAQRLDVRQVA